MGLIKDLLKKTAMGGGSTSNAGASGCYAGASSLTLDARRLDAMNPGERLAALRKELIVNVKEELMAAKALDRLSGPVMDPMIGDLSDNILKMFPFEDGGGGGPTTEAFLDAIRSPGPLTLLINRALRSLSSKSMTQNAAGTNCVEESACFDRAAVASSLRCVRMSRS